MHDGDDDGGGQRTVLKAAEWDRKETRKNRSYSFAETELGTPGTFKAFPSDDSDDLSCMTKGRIEKSIVKLERRFGDSLRVCAERNWDPV